MRRFLTFLLVLLLAAGTAALYRGQLKPLLVERGLLRRKLALAEEENTRLRGLVQQMEQARVVERERAAREGIEQKVAKLRGLPFKQPVTYDVVTKEQIKGVVMGKLQEVYSKEEFDHMSRAFQRLGVLPEGYPLLEKYLALLGEQIAAFYDQHQHKLFMFADATLQRGQNRVILAHELTHALQDQHFDLKRLPLEIKDNDDRAISASALVEGDATVLMNLYLVDTLSADSLGDTLGSAMGQSMEQIASVPPYLRELLLFPYLQGQIFAQTLYTGGGFAALNEAYKNPPTSTTQILHPEKFLRREDPVAVQWPEVRWQNELPVVTNVLGELGVRSLLALKATASEAAAAAEGWRGDKYLYFAKADALVWKTVWASEQEATAFYQAEVASLQQRYKQYPKPGLENDELHLEGKRHVRLRRVTGNTLLLVDAGSAEELESLWKQFGQ